MPLCLAHGIGIIPYAPLAQGVLAGRYTDTSHFPPNSRAALQGGVYAGRVNARGIEVAQGLIALAQERGLGPACMALLWTKDQPGITAPIFGPRTVAHLERVLPVLHMNLPEDVRAVADACPAGQRGDGLPQCIVLDETGP